MRDYPVRVGIALLCIALVFAGFALAQQPGNKKPAEVSPSAVKKSSGAPSESQLNTMFESKVTAEWEALKKKDKKAYGELLAEDYEGVEADGRGERTKIQAINEVPNGNVYDYTLQGFKLISSSPDTAFLVYEINMQFPPKSVVRFSRIYIGELWVKRSGEWRELHYQETHVK